MKLFSIIPLYPYLIFLIGYLVLKERIRPVSKFKELKGQVRRELLVELFTSIVYYPAMVMVAIYLFPEFSGTILAHYCLLVLYFIFIFGLFLLKGKPELVTHKFFNDFISYSYNFAIGLTLGAIAGKFVGTLVLGFGFNNFSGSYVVNLTILIVGTIFTIRNINTYKKKGLVVSEYYSTLLLNPQEISKGIEKKMEKEGNIILAKHILKQIRVRYGDKVGFELSRELVKKYSPRTFNWKSLVFALFVFIIASVGEGFFQDMLYEPMKPYLCKLNIKFLCV